LLTAILPALIIVVGSVEDVHLAAGYLDGLRAGHPQPRTAAVAHMARHVGPAIIVTSVTTVIGFASNVVTDIPLIREFSLAAAFAMFANLIVTVCVVPLLLHAFGPTVSRLHAESGAPRGLIGQVVGFVETVTERYSTVVIVVVLGLVLGFGWQIGQLKVNNDPMAYFPANHPFVQDATRVHHDLAGLQSFGVMLQADSPGWFKTVEGLAAVARVQQLLEHQALYDRTVSLADLMSLMHQEMHAGNPDFHLPPSKQADYDLYLSSMPRSELAHLVTADYATALISVRHSVADSVRLNAAVDHLNTVLPSVLGDGIRFAVAGKNLMVNRAAESLITGEAISLAIILAVIFSIFAFLYTSWMAGVLALIPNVIPIVINFGIMGWLGVPLNPGTAMVAAIAIGLAVDDTIHLMTRFGAESRLRVDERAAVRATIRGEAVPVLTTAVALGLGFAVFGLSNFRIVAEFGLLAAGTMVYAAVADLFLMPILLRHLRLATIWDIIALDVEPAVLSRCPLFEDMSSYQVKKLILLSELVTFDAEEVLIVQGDVSSGMYVILKGEVSISIAREGRDLVIDTGKAGDIFGEIGFSGSELPRTATIRALTPVTAVRLDAGKAGKGLRFYPAIATRVFRNISRLLGTRLGQSHARLLEVSSGAGSDRFQK
jgi:predicted RND superfamily exporter protein/CRP-like cAMP-binding protein